MGDLHHIGHTLIENGGDEISIVHYVSVDYTQDPALLNVMCVSSLTSNIQDTNIGKLALFAPQGN